MYNFHMTHKLHSVWHHKTEWWTNQVNLIHLGRQPIHTADPCRVDQTRYQNLQFYFYQTTMCHNLHVNRDIWIKSHEIQRSIVLYPDHSRFVTFFPFHFHIQTTKMRNMTVMVSLMLPDWWFWRSATSTPHTGSKPPNSSHLETHRHLPFTPENRVEWPNLKFKNDELDWRRPKDTTWR